MTCLYCFHDIEHHLAELFSFVFILVSLSLLIVLSILYFSSKLNRRISEVQKHLDGKQEGTKIAAEGDRCHESNINMSLN